MQNLNFYLFSFLNAPADLSGWLLALAFFTAKVLVYLVPLCLVIYWLWRPKSRGTLLFALASTLLALLMSYVVGLLWYQPRPFMLGMGHTYLMHAPDTGFPSDHMTFMWAIGLSFFIQPALRLSGSILLLLALCVGWARIFLGVHFPFDILGGILIASFAVIVLSPAQSWINQRVLPVAESIYRKVFTLLIGWRIVRG